FAWADERAWRRLRTLHRARYGLPEHPEPLPRTGTFPAARGVGRTSDGNVVIADPAWTRGNATAKLSLDPANPAMFERLPGHITGLALVEAARQSALWALSRHLALPTGQLAITGLDTVFDTVGELDVPATCEATVTADRGGRGAVTVRILQRDRALATASVEAVRTL
ncbi:AfsA-related hotdog domain-containing protein, partial [Actinocorallia lasiicapitis]